MKKGFILTFMGAALFLLTACGSDTIDVNKTKADKYGSLSYEVPSAFEKQTLNDSYEGSSLVFSNYHYTYEKEGSNGKYDDMCSLSFFYDTDPEDYTLDEYAGIYHDGITGTKKTINGVEWVIMEEKTNDKMIEYSYYAKYGDRFYEVSYSDWGSGSICGDALKVIENSLKFN